MVEARQTQGLLRQAWTLATVAAVGLTSVGCTMCPDPFDYSGPVPNGSAPQNDFRARSGGILPLGAAPKPWPQIVNDGSGPATRPQESGPTGTLADEAGADDLQQAMAVVEGSAEEALGNGQPKVAADSAGATPDALEPVPTIAQPTKTPRAAVGQAAVQEEQRPVQQPPAAPVSRPGPAGETPGWRARRP